MVSALEFTGILSWLITVLEFIGPRSLLIDALGIIGLRTRKFYEQLIRQ